MNIIDHYFDKAQEAYRCEYANASIRVSLTPMNDAFKAYMDVLKDARKDPAYLEACALAQAQFDKDKEANTAGIAP